MDEELELFDQDLISDNTSLFSSNLIKRRPTRSYSIHIPPINNIPGQFPDQSTSTSTSTFDFDPFTELNYESIQRGIDTVPNSTIKAASPIQEEEEEDFDQLKQELINILSIPSLVQPLSPTSFNRLRVRRSKTPTIEELKSFFGGIPQLSKPCLPQSEDSIHLNSNVSTAHQKVKVKRKRLIEEDGTPKKRKKQFVAPMTTPTLTLPIPFAFSPPPIQPSQRLRNDSHNLSPLSSLRFPVASSSNDMGRRSPTLAEMDAFFGYQPPAPVIALDSFIASEVARMQEIADETRNRIRDRSITATCAVMMTIQGMRRVREAMIDVEEDPEVIKRYQMTKIDSDLSSNERRLAIIQALELVTLSILQQIFDSVAPSTPSKQLGGTAERKLLAETTGKSRKGTPLIVLLCKRKGTDVNPNESTTATRRLVFPRRFSKTELRCGSRELAAFLKTIELIIESLKRETVVTKRDLFYRSVALFINQSIVDNIVEDIAATLGVRRSDLNVVAASKGLFAGGIQIVNKDGSILEGIGSQGALISPIQLIDRVSYSSQNPIKWILIIEKEAVFQALNSPSFLNHAQLPQGVIITGKGYPDLATRELVKKLSEDLPSVPILALVDSDPHGLEILSTYKYGSAALSFDRHNLSVPRIEWIGVKGSEWDKLGIDRGELLSLGAGDRKKALGMLKRNWWPEAWKRELEYMLHLGKKAEIQVLASIAGDGVSTAVTQAETPLIKYLIRKINDRLLQT